MNKVTYEIWDTDEHRGRELLGSYSSKEEAENDLSHFEERYNITCEIINKYIK